MQHLEDIDGFLGATETQRAVDVVILTSAVTVGSDINMQFDSVFVEFTGRFACTARDIMQMMGRFRKVTCLDVLVLYQSDPEFYPGMEQIYQSKLMNRTKDTEAQRRMFQEITKQDIAIEKLLDDVPLHVVWDTEENKMRLSPDWFTDLFIANEISVAQNQEYMLFANARRGGWRVFICGDDAEAVESYEEERKASKKAIKEERNVKSRTLFDELKTKSYMELKTAEQSETSVRELPILCCHTLCQTTQHWSTVLL